MKDNNKPQQSKQHNSSRQHHSKLKSNSKSHDKYKQRSDSKLLLKLKQHDNNHNSQQQPTLFEMHINISKKHSQKLLRETQQTNSMNQYYNSKQGKSKSKRKPAGNEQQFSKSNFVNNIYMHKEEKDSLTMMLSQNEKIINGYDQSAQQHQKGHYISNNLLHKIKSLQKAGGFDSNGRYISKDNKKHLNNKHIESQYHTISLYQQDKKKDGIKKKDRNRKQPIKNRLKKQEKLGLANNKILSIKSLDKMYKKKEVKHINSPIMLTKQQKNAENDSITLNENHQKTKLKQNTKHQMAMINNKTSKTFFLEQTQSSPPQINIPEPAIIIEDLIKELKEDKQIKLNYSKLKMVYANSLVQRIKSIELICKISNNMGIRRESHSLAIYYIDRYMISIQKDVTPKQFKLIALTSLLLATKIDDGIMSRKLCHQYINHMGSILNLSKTPIKNKLLQKGKDISGLSSKETSGSNLRAKGNSIIGQLGAAKQQGKSGQKQQGSWGINQMNIIHSLQLDMLVRFGFKIVKKSSTYWIDSLTALWDNYINQEELASEEYLLFRSTKNKKNISHCYQIIELLSLDIESYKYSASSLVFSTMYLIIRMRLEEYKQNISEAQIYAKYINDLNKSTNLIFYDKVGINELFGDFLIQVQMNISDIIDCIQFVGRNLITSFRTFSFQSKNRNLSAKYDFQLSIYEESCEIYKAKGLYN